MYINNNNNNNNNNTNIYIKIKLKGIKYMQEILEKRKNVKWKLFI